ncbi:MAG TPA: cell division protein FtsZ [Candidatus Methylomirabilis sp.]|jgi:cell division protein FtsZ
MAFALEMDPERVAKIRVLGVGGGGSNAVNRMYTAEMTGVEFIVMNTDAQVLKRSPVPTRLQLGEKLTRGLGAGAKPEVGRKAALDDSDRVLDLLQGSDMVFITAGLGGGTGTGAAPVIANLAKSQDILTVGVVTKPFLFEGQVRMGVAERGLEELREQVDSLITIPNQRLLNVADKKTSFMQAFRMADDVLMQAVRGISDLITKPGEVNVDFADVRTIMGERGIAMMGTGAGTGENGAVEAAQKAINSELLENHSIEGAKGIIINFTASPDLTIYQMTEASELIKKLAHPGANIIFGLTVDEALADEVRVTVIATGFDRTGKPEAAPAEPPKVIDIKANAAKTAERGQYLRKRAAAGGRTDQLALQDLNEGELDIPTFMRRQAD